MFIKNSSEAEFLLESDIEPGLDRILMKLLWEKSYEKNLMMPEFFKPQHSV